MTARELRPFGSGRSDQRLPVPGDASRDALRERLVQALGIHFANDDLSMEELERRLTLAFQASTPAQLAELTADLPAIAEEVGGASPTAVGQIAPAGVPERGVLIAFMGGNERKGGWLVPRYLKVIAIMGGAELDLRQALFAPGVTEIEVLAVMGGVEVIVPPGVRVETTGVAVMGAFGADTAEERVLGPEQPVVRLSGLAFMAGVEAKQKRPSTKALAKFRRALKVAQRRAAKDAR